MFQEVLPEVTVRITHSLCSNEASQHILKGPNFSLLGRVRGGRGVGPFGFLLFLMCSHHVLQVLHVFLNMFLSSQCVPNSISLYPISFALSFTHFGVVRKCGEVP
jgi:hypothetical protein